MGWADHANTRSLRGHLSTDVEKARLASAPLFVLFKTLFRLWWERIRG